MNELHFRHPNSAIGLSVRLIGYREYILGGKTMEKTTTFGL